MPITVAEALAIGPLQRARVIAGSRGLGRLIKTVTIMDTPDITAWLKGGELVLANLFVIKDDPAAQVELIRGLVDKGAAALGLKLKRFVDTIPEQMTELANEMELPVLEVPIDCAWIDILIPVYSEIINRQLVILERSEQVHELLIETVLSGEGLEGILRVLSTILQRSCAVFDDDFNLLCSAPDPWEQSLVSTIRDGAQRSKPKSLQVNLDFRVLDYRATKMQQRFLLLPVEHHCNVYGYIVVQEGAHELSEMDLITIERAASEVAREMLARAALDEVERRFRNDFLHDLLNGQIKSRQAIFRRARAIGFNPNRRYAAIVIDIDRAEEHYLSNSDSSESHFRNILAKFVRAVDRVLASNEFVLMDESDSVTLLAPVSTDSPEKARQQLILLSERIRNAVAKELSGITVSIGIGKPCENITDISASYQEAIEALHGGRLAYGPSAITYYDDLGVYRLLGRVQAENDLITFYKETVMPLDAYDQKHNADLLQTLQVFLQENGSIRKVAERLYLHPNTVRQRLQRIERLTRKSLTSVEDVLSLATGLKVRNILRNRQRMS